MHKWDDNIENTLIKIFNFIKESLHISTYAVPVFIFIIIVLLLMQLLGNKLNKPIYNISSFFIAIILLMYFGILT